MRQRPPNKIPRLPTTRLTLTSTRCDGTTYQFRADNGLGWALCTVNDETGELLITSDWGNWSHRWDQRPSSLGAPSLTAFIGGRGGVDYLARKLQREGSAGRRFSARLTAKRLLQRLYERRLEDGRAQESRRLELDEAPLAPRSSYDEAGLPIYSQRMPAASRGGRPWDIHGKLYDPLPYLTRDAARRLWIAIEDLAKDTEGSPDLFYERVHQIEGFTDHVTEEAWEFNETAQTPEDQSLRDIVLPALIEACRTRRVTNTMPTPDVLTFSQQLAATVASTDDVLITTMRAAENLCALLNPCTLPNERPTPP